MRTLLLVVLLGATTTACGTRPPLTFSPDTLPDATVGVPYSAVITISGNETPVGDVSSSVGVPNGLTLHWDENGDRNRAELTGTPLSAATYEFTISAWCLGTNVNGQTGSHKYSVLVNGYVQP